MQDNVYITRPSILLTYIKYKPVNCSEFYLLMAVSAILYDHHNHGYPLRLCVEYDRSWFNIQMKQRPPDIKRCEHKICLVFFTLVGGNNFSSEQLF